VLAIYTKEKTNLQAVINELDKLPLQRAKVIVNLCLVFEGREVVIGVSCQTEGLDCLVYCINAMQPMLNLIDIPSGFAVLI
jgi:hypothetical protein